MKHYPIFYTLLMLLALGLGGCDLVGDIFEFGFWVAVIVIALIVGLAIWLFRKFRRP